jgi:TolB-like protein/DNA-binding winged helix-turn-helix (wHTH) protein/cytochrome c-type biogenesis protein CcmH/NrfG
MDATKETRTYRFRDFELDLGAQQLCLRGEPVRLERRPFDLLALLVANHGRLVSREEIIGRLWPGNVVIEFETGVNTLVRKVRKALGDSSEHPQFIETVSGRGYRFIAPVVEAERPQSGPEQSVSVLAGWKRSSRIAAGVLLLLATVAAVFLLPAGNPESSPLRIAVLPFENLTGNEDLGYLASGLAEETSTSLAQIDLPGLRVIGGVSSRAFANSALPMQQVGHELGVDYAVQSSLRLDQSRIRVTSRLIRVADGEQVWTASFDRELTNVLGLQRELSIAIAEQIRQRLSPEVIAGLDRRQTENPEAYQLYLKGRYEWARFLPGSTSRALRYFEKAVAEDPGYALAWAGIAHALITSQMTADARAEAVVPAAWDALQRALRLGPDLAEVHYTQAYYHLFVGWDYRATEAAARRAITLDPNSAISYMLLSFALSDRGNDVEALAMMRRARELDPLFPLLFANSAIIALEAGDPPSAIEFCRQAIAINPEFWVGHYQLGNAYFRLGDDEAAISAYTDAERLSNGNSKPVAYRAYVLAQAGREDEARTILQDLKSRIPHQYVPPYAIALIHTGLGESDLAVEWLERALAVRDVHLIDLRADSSFASLRGDPRFETLLREIEEVTKEPASL